MLGSFRVRLLLVLLLLIGVLSILNFHSPAWYRVEPVLEYIMKDDYALNQKLWGWFKQSDLKDRLAPEPEPVSSTGVVQSPCTDGRIVRHFGWYWDSKTQKQEFSPGVVVKMPENSVIQAVLGGTVEEISRQGEDNREILINHGGDLISVYRGMKEVFVNIGDQVTSGQTLGKSQDEFEFELRNQDGPLNPEPLFQ